MSKRIKEKISEVMNIPEELITDSPKIEFDSNKRMWVENYRGIVEYSDDLVRINTADFILVIKGNSFVISSITLDDLCIEGNIASVEYNF